MWFIYIIATKINRYSTSNNGSSVIQREKTISSGENMENVVEILFLVRWIARLEQMNANKLNRKKYYFQKRNFLFSWIGPLRYRIMKKLMKSRLYQNFGKICSLRLTEPTLSYLTITDMICSKQCRTVFIYTWRH